MLSKLLLLVVSALLLFTAVCADAALELYADLGVRPAASTTEIRRAFRQLARQNHPDLKETAAEREAAKLVMAKLLRAYEVLSDVEKRKAYDEMGIVPGEAIDPTAHSAEEIFEYYRKSTPIFSKSVTLESVTTLRNLLRYRGPRMFLLQVFDDDDDTCRRFAEAWEMLYASALVSAGVLEMYRIDRKSPEGEALLRELGYKPSVAVPLVTAVVDGKQWKHATLAEGFTRGHGASVFGTLLKFTMTFFYDVHAATHSLALQSARDVAGFLDGPAAPAQPFRALVSPVHAESLYIALQLRYPGVEFQFAARNPLQAYVTDYCEMELKVLNRHGDPVDEPEFIVLSTPVREEESSGADGSDNDDDGDARVCPRIQVGASVELDWQKAEKFLAYHLPPPHKEMGRVARIDADGFYDNCRKNCVLWVRPTCDPRLARPAEAEAARRIMGHHYLSFRTGYICLDEQPAAMGEALGTHRRRLTSPLVLAVLDGDNTHTYVLPSLLEKSYQAISTGDLDDALAELLDAAPAERRVAFPQPFFTLFATEPFPLSSSQKFMLTALVWLRVVSPFVTKMLPFLVVYIVRKRFRGGASEDSAGDRNNNNSSSSSSNNAAGGTGNGNDAASRPPPPKARTVPVTPKEPLKPTMTGIFNAHDDIAKAKTGNGFLIVFVDRRPKGAGAMPLPRITLDPRFTVRVFSAKDTQWIDWARENTPECSGPGDVPEAEAALSLVAIRMRRMTVAVKPDNQSIDSFLRDLLDGTRSTTLQMPIFPPEAEDDKSK